MSDALDFRSRASVERVRAAIAEAGEEKLARVAHIKRFRVDLLRARAEGRSLRELAAVEGCTRQTIHYREQRALRALSRNPLEWDPLGGM